MVKKFHQFISDVNFEMNKVSWPNWEELKGSTYVVLITTLLMIIFLFLIDFLLSKVLNFQTNFHSRAWTLEVCFRKRKMAYF